MNRNLKLDNLKGILIYLVVLGHLLFSYTYYNSNECMFIVRIIYCFHMPIFFMVSGFLSKEVKNKSLFSFIMLFCLVNLSYIIFDYVRFGTVDILSIKYSSWFLLYLFLYRLFVKWDVVKNFLNKYKKYILVFLFILVILIGFTSLPIVRFCYFFFFFMLGYFWNLKKIKFSFWKSLRWIIVIFTFFIVISIFPASLDFYMGFSYYNSIEVVFRILLLILNPLLFICLYCLLPNKKINLISDFGKYSLGIYVMHRIFTLVLTDYIIGSKYFIVLCIVLALIICILLGNKIFNNCLNTLLDWLYKFYYYHKKVFCLIVICLILSAIVFYKGEDIYHYFKDVEVVSDEELGSIENSFSIGFVGDLILLENQVSSSYSNGSYNFDYMFDYTSKYFHDVDYMIGVLEGPSDDDSEYSYGNFDDGKELRLNYPSSFLDSIKDSGFDLVSISNNHLFDRGVDSVNKTILNLDEKSLDYVGAYDNRIKVVEVEEIKIGVLAYTYGINYYTFDEIMDEYWEVTGYLCSSDSKYFNVVKDRVEEDFKYLKSEGVDIIIVMPHYGTQFSNDVDDYQRLWDDIFVSNGADIILGDHSHRVQPINYEGDTLIVHSPGNYVNSYTDYDGDVSMMVKVYIDRDKKKVSGAGIIPLLTVEDGDNRYTSITVYDGINNNKFSNYEERFRYANEKVTDVGINYKVGIKDIEREYLYFKSGYKRENKYRFIFNDDDKNSEMYKLMSESNGVCFVGDSITEGTKNGFHPWYQELVSYFDDLDVYSFAKGGYTSFDVVNYYLNDLSESSCDLVVVNIGTNDIRYNLTSEDVYIDNIYDILENILDRNIVLLSPWRTYDGDVYLKKNKNEKNKLYNEYDKELSKIAEGNDNIYFIDSNLYIKKAIDENGIDTYLLDGVHPNDGLGIKLYSFSVLRSG